MVVPSWVKVALATAPDSHSSQLKESNVPTHAPARLTGPQGGTTGFESLWAGQTKTRARDKGDHGTPPTSLHGDLLHGTRRCKCIVPPGMGKGNGDLLMSVRVRSPAA